MAVDRGGLQYTITVVNQFSAPLRQFRDELKAARRSFKRFRGELGRLGSAKTAKDIDRIGAALRKQVAANSRLIASTSAKVAALRQDVTALKAQTAAQKAALLAAVKQDAAQRRLNITRRAAERALRRIAAAQRRAALAAKRHAAALRRTESAANRTKRAFGGLNFTLRRVVTSLALFAGVRFAFQGVRNLIVGTVQFSAAIEQATLGAAALFTAVGTIEDASGKALKGQEALTEAMRISEAQIKKLRVESLRTTATFDQLVLAFATATGPGLRAGLNPDEIRKFTVQISQAASALGVKQRDLAEEIRSILSGTIREVNTRIARELQITNPQIRAAKKAGTLVDLLNEKFLAFSVASSKVLATFDARLSNAIDSLLLIQSKGAKGFVTELKEGLKDVVDAIVTINEEANELEVNPQAVEVFRTIFDALAGAVTDARNLRESLDFSDLAQIAAGIATFIDLISTAFFGVFSGAIQGARDLSNIFGFIGRLLKFITGQDIVGPDTLETAGRMLAVFTRIFVVVKGMRLAMALFSSNLLRIVVLGLAAAAAFNSLAEDVPRLAEALTGIEDVSLAGFFEVFAAQGAAAIKNLLLRYGLFLFEVKALFSATFSEIGLEIGNALIRALDFDVLRSFLEGLRDLEAVPGPIKAIADAFLAIADAIPKPRTIDDFAVAVAAGAKAELKGVRDVTKALIDKNDAVVAGVISARRAFEEGGGTGLTDEGDQEFLDKFLEEVTSVADKIRTIFADLGVEIPEGFEEALDKIDLGKVIAPEDKAKIKSDFTDVTDFMKAQGRRLADEIGSAIVDAFDPNRDVDIRQRLINFLKAFAKEAISILLQIAVARAIALGGAAGGGEVKGGGQVKGGQVRPQGFAVGGSPIPSMPAPKRLRPRGLDPRDTVPIWVQPREWIIRKSSSLLYGSKVMSAINQGMIDPFALQALAGLSPSVTRRQSRGVGYQTGGSVQSARVTAQAPSAPQDQVVGAVIVADEQAMDRLLGGGRNAMLDFISDEAQVIKGLLS